MTLKQEKRIYWPEMWSLEYLKRKKTGTYSFSFQYMNQIVRQNELSLAPELIVKAEISTEFDTLGIGIDLSAGVKEKMTTQLWFLVVVWKIVFT